jgi:hypothetical protein
MASWMVFASADRTQPNIAFGVLGEALQAAINIWNEGVMGACLLSDSGVFDAYVVSSSINPSLLF